VKLAVQAYTKKHGKTKGAKLLDEFGQKTVRTLKKLSKKQLMKLNKKALK